MRFLMRSRVGCGGEAQTAVTSGPLCATGCRLGRVSGLPEGSRLSDPTMGSSAP